jgi:hypothetical protein
MSSGTACDFEPYDGLTWYYEPEPYIALSYDYGTSYSGEWYRQELHIPQFPPPDIDDIHTFEYPPIISEAPEMLPISGGELMSFYIAPEYQVPRSYPTYFPGAYARKNFVQRSEQASMGMHRDTTVDTVGYNVAPDVPGNEADCVGPCPAMDNDNSSWHDCECHHDDCNHCSHPNCDLGPAVNDNLCNGCDMFHIAGDYRFRSVLDNNIFLDRAGHECTAP